MNKFKFNLNGKTIVLIDWANVYNWKKDIDPQKLFQYLKAYSEIKSIYFFFGEDENYKSINFLKKCKKIGYKIISKKVKYVPIKINKSPFNNYINLLYEQTKSYMNKFSTLLKNYIKKNSSQTNNNILQEIKETQKIGKKLLNKINKNSILRRKCDFDVEITKEILINIDNFQTFILFSGDGYYAPVVQYLLNKQKRIFVIASHNSLRKELWELKDKKIHPLLININKILEPIKNFPGRKTSRA